MKRSFGRYLLVVVVLAAVAAAAAIAWKRKDDDRASDELELYGNVDIRQVELAFSVSDRITTLLVEEGDLVKKGQCLATLDESRYRDRVALAKGDLEAQQQVVARLEAGTRPEKIRKARADLAAAKANEVDASRTYKRVVALTKTGAKTAEDADDAKAAWQSAADNVDAMQAELDLAVAGPRKEDIAAAKATLAAREAALKLAERDLTHARLVAPNDGVIQDRILQVGDMASPTTPVFTVALISPVWIRVYADERDLGKLTPGMKAIVKTDSFPDKEYHGWVGFISPTAEFTPKPVETTQLRTRLVYQVRVFVDDSHNELRLGMPATVILRLNQQGQPPESSRPSTEGA